MVEIKTKGNLKNMFFFFANNKIITKSATRKVCAINSNKKLKTIVN